MDFCAESSVHYFGTDFKIPDCVIQEGIYFDLVQKMSNEHRDRTILQNRFLLNDLNKEFLQSL